MQNTAFKKYCLEFFSNKFIYRFIIWLIGIGIFAFGLNFIVRSGVGQDVYDVLFNSFRITLGVSLSHYGLGILLPGGTILTIIALILYYLRNRKIRIDYILAVIPLIFSGYLIDLVGKLSFFQTMASESNTANWVYQTYPLHILWIIIGVPLLYLGVGTYSGVRIMPNPYPIFIAEIAILCKKKFVFIQFISDLSFAFIGLCLMLISASVGRVVDNHMISWYDIIKFISLGTVLSLGLQGLIIGKSVHFLEKLFNYEHHV